MLQLSQLFTLFSLVLSVGEGLEEKNIVVSSAKRMDLRIEEELTISLMYIRNRKGPRTLP